MSWGNPANTYNHQNMDSSDGAQDARLSVRNHEAPAPDGTWRAEIKETDLPNRGLQALKVNGLAGFFRQGPDGEVHIGER
ncbi:hypothetical protein HZB60_02140 [candidate division KSB1 bacterium]|nr:hypothetical protein [candidate division KSB1 bacterium]